MKNLFLLLLCSQAFAGTNNLPVEHSGTIQLQHVNKFQTALSGDFVPRNSSGNVTDIGANLGSTTYRWNTLLAKKFQLIQDFGGNAISFVSPSSLASAYTLTFPTALTGSSVPVPVLMDSSGNLTAPSLGYAQSSVCTSATTTSSASFTNVTNLSVTITTGGRPVTIMVQGAGDTDSFLGVGATTNNISRYQIYNATSSTILARYSSVPDLGAGQRIPLSTLSYVDNPAAGTYNYVIRFENGGGVGGVTSVVNAVLVAYELP